MGEMLPFGHDCVWVCLYIIHLKLCFSALSPCDLALSRRNHWTRSLSNPKRTKKTTPSISSPPPQWFFSFLIWVSVGKLDLNACYVQHEIILINMRTDRKGRPSLPHTSLFLSIFSLSHNSVKIIYVLSRWPLILRPCNPIALAQVVIVSWKWKHSRVCCRFMKQLLDRFQTWMSPRVFLLQWMLYSNPFSSLSERYEEIVSFWQGDLYCRKVMFLSS